ncbi:hypothetical protein ACRAWF_33250 [Streptomyces sp. L7]
MSSLTCVGGSPPRRRRPARNAHRSGGMASYSCPAHPPPAVAAAAARRPSAPCARWGVAGGRHHPSSPAALVPRSTSPSSSTGSVAVAAHPGQRRPARLGGKRPRALVEAGLGALPVAAVGRYHGRRDGAASRSCAFPVAATWWLHLEELVEEAARRTESARVAHLDRSRPAPTRTAQH